MNHGPGARRGVLALVGGAVFIGFAPIWVRWSEVGPVATAGYRLLIAIPMLWIWAQRERRASRPKRGKAAGIWLTMTGVLFALDLGVWHLSIRFTTVANATLLGNLAPIFVSLGAWAFFGERIRWSFVAGLIQALMGAWILTGASVGRDPVRWKGDLLGVATAVFYGGYQLGVARLRRDEGAGHILLGSSAIAGPLLACAAVLLHEKLVPETAGGWGVLIGLSLTAQILGQGLITYGFAHLPAGHSSLTLLLQPLVAAFAGWILLGESLGGGQILGGLVLLGGIYLARREGPPSTDEPAARSEKKANGGPDQGPVSLLA